MKFRILYLVLVAMVGFLSNADAADPITGSAGVVQSTDYYWITFSGDCSCDDVFVMQIDGDGNILRGPTAVLDVETYGAGASGLVKMGNSKLVLLHWKSSSYMARAIIDKGSLKASKIKTTSLWSYENEFLHITQNSSGNFLIAEDPLQGKLSKYDINKKGIPKSTKTDLAPQAPMDSDEASISSDGQVVITNRFSSNGGKEKLYVQLLDSQGTPKDSPKYLTTYTDIESVDVSNPLEDGSRFVVYTVDAGTNPDDRIYLQKINDAGKKVGKKIVVNTPPDRHEDSQTVGIDPLGRFVLFTMGGEDYGCVGNDILVYQRLNSNGSPNGPVKVLGSCELVTDDIMNIDILKE